MSQTIEQYLQIIPQFKFEDNIIESVLGKNGIPAGSDAFQYDEDGVEPKEWTRKRDLAEADMWDKAALVFNGGGERIAMGNRSVTSATHRLSRYDRQTFLDKANSLRAKWNAVEEDISLPKIYNGTLLW